MEKAPPLNFNLKVQGRSQPHNADQPTSSSTAANQSDAAPVNAQPQQQKKKNAAKTSAASTKPAVSTKAQSKKGSDQENKGKHKNGKEEKTAAVRQKKIGNIQHKSIPSNNPKRLPDGKLGPNWINIDKESKYNENDVLGIGCDGTIVFRGEMDGRKVAVKRVLLTINLPNVEREKELQIASDDNQNILRYLRTKSDRLFRYLILELCEASLADYVEKKVTRDSLNITTKEVLRQTTKGLAHLHNSNIKIVHRDLKPRNVLFFRSASGEIIMKLSDFGAGKRIEDGRLSFSVTNGLVGTSGWIAPEVLNSETTVTDKIDIFSLGCIFYYVLTGGCHPYGTPLFRNNNIIKGEFSLADLASDDDRLSSHLISRAIAFSPTLRPSANAILSHPFFWDTKMQLEFFSEVSNRLTREPSGTSIVMKRLEKDEFKVIKSDWTKHVCHGVLQDLMKFRQYDGTSVRDLLRVIRNYKSHYEERPPAVQRLLGEYPHGLAVYFTGRFPDLLLHVHAAMELYCENSVFAPFYSDDTRTLVRKEREEAEKKIPEVKTKKKNEKKVVTPTAVNATPTNNIIPLLEEPPHSPKYQAIPDESLTSTASSSLLTADSRGSNGLQFEMAESALTPSTISTPEELHHDPIPESTLMNLVAVSSSLFTASENCEGNAAFSEMKRIIAPTVASSSNSATNPEEQHNRSGVSSIEKSVTSLVCSSVITATEDCETSAMQSELENATLIDGAVTVEELIEQAGLNVRRIEEDITVPVPENWIGKLNEFCAENKLPLPEYKYEETGPPNERVFTAHATTDIFKESGSGKKKQEAKLDVAKRLHETIRIHGIWVDRLKQFCERNALPAPEYEVEESGPPNERVFTSRVTVCSSSEIGRGRRKQDAKADAARILYQTIDFLPLLSNPTHGLWVGRLAEMCLKNKLPEPRYSETVEEIGSDNIKTFTTLGMVGDFEEIGRGKNKKESKADAARKLAGIVQKQVAASRKVTEETTTNNEREDEREESIDGILAQPVVDVSRAHTEEAPREAIKTILSDKTRFLSHSLVYRDVAELSTRGRTQAYLTVEFTMADGEQKHKRVFSGEGMNKDSARDDSARAALVHLLTYEQ